MRATCSASTSVAGRMVRPAEAESAVNALASFVDDHFAVFFRKVSALWRRQDVEYGLRGPAQPRAESGRNERPVDEDRMLDHRVQQRIVGKLLVVEPEFEIGRALLPDRVTYGKAGSLDHLD